MLFLQYPIGKLNLIVFHSKSGSKTKNNCILIIVLFEELNIINNYLIINYESFNNKSDVNNNLI